MSNWTQEEIELLEELRELGWTYAEIADYMTNNGFTPRRRDAVKKFASRQNQSKREYYADDMNLRGLDEKYRNTIRDIMDLRDEYVRVTTEKFIQTGHPVNAEKKILTLSDLHAPFINRFVIEDALAKHSDADILVLNGDLLDHFCVSKWPKSKSILLRWEYEVMVELMQLFVSIFPKIVLVSGNHENRLSKMFSAKIDPAVSFLTAPDLLQRLAQGFDFDEDDQFVPMHDWGGKVVYDSSALRWYAKIGQAIFVHPSKGYSTVPMTNARKAAMYFDAREEYQCLVMAHTHQQGQIIHRGKLLFDQGCCCVPLEYEASGDMQFGGQVFGYGLVYMDKEGNVDFDRTGPIYVGTGSPIKLGDSLDLL